ncbi:hypothetical protein [Paenibacillus lautus]|uniref:hypothetical protein n=1 Tax=Paenibacillus lautus TaxID=1401 RepID=UPI001C112B37|nr:hypothetical protein [Paenibacillus lautus]MBU5348328.1 hypothetical protein [Paenibacillus lautus]
MGKKHPTIEDDGLFKAAKVLEGSTVAGNRFCNWKERKGHQEHSSKQQNHPKGNDFTEGSWGTHPYSGR